MFGIGTQLLQQLMQQQGQQGLLGNNSGLPRSQGLLGGELGSQTQNMMQNYLQNLFMRRYNPPAIAQQPGMVSSSLGQGGRQYQAPQIANVPLPGAQSRNTAPQGSTPYPQGGGYMLNGQGYFSDGTWDPNAGNWSS